MGRKWERMGVNGNYGNEWEWMGMDECFRLSLPADVVGNPLPYFSGAILGTALHLNLGSADVGLKGSVNGLAHEGTLLLEVEVLQEHGHGEYLGQRIGDIEALGLGP